MRDENYPIISKRTFFTSAYVCDSASQILYIVWSKCCSSLRGVHLGINFIVRCYQSYLEIRNIIALIPV
jgi:hypothetical protein